VQWQIDEPRVKYTHYVSEHGLPGNCFEHIVIDGRGHPWVAGCRSGISYFDGSHWHTLEEAMGKKPPLTLSTDTNGAVWVGGSSGVGNFHWDGARPMWRPFDLSDAPLPLTEIRAIAVESQRHLWLGTMWGLYGYSFQAQSWQRYTRHDGLPDNVVSCLQIAPDGSLWVGTVRGVAVLLDGELSMLQGIDGLVESIAFDRAGDAIWIVAEQRLWRSLDGEWNRFSDDIVPVEIGPAEVVVANEMGHVWVGFDSGLVQPKAGMRVLSAAQHSELLVSAVRSIAADLPGRLWAGTVNELWVYESDRWRCCRPGNEIEFPLEGITGIVASSRDDVWVGSWLSSDRGGLRRFVEVTEVPLLNEVLGSIDALTLDEQEHLWLASDLYVKCFRFDGQSLKTVTQIASPDVFAQVLLVDARGALWLGSPSGLYQHVDNEWVEYLTDVEVNALLQDDETLWIGTAEGLWYVRNDRNIKQHEVTESLPSQEITSLAEARTGGLWVGTMEGLALVENQEVSVWRAKDSGLTCDRVLALALVNDDLWIGTSNGVSHFSPAKEGAS
jgi:ligand-binding sensor domain-containing protein